MDLVSGDPFWPLKNGLLTSYPALDRSVSCDVVVLGAGITGALVAHHLAAEGVAVVVLDKHDVALGSTAASTSLLQYEIDVPLHRLIRLLGEPRAVRAYLRTTEDNRAIIGGYDEPVRDPRCRDAFLPRKRVLLERRLRRLLPALQAETAYAWTGCFAETPDGLPYIGPHPQVPHTLFALGYGGNGITYSLIAAEIVRDLHCEGRSHDADLFSFERRKP